ncbi:hypothetical protein HOLDEFILI_01089 [Holdemania filiformis DSM 12042]|uniref:Uncharacterized protein n=1 Tax=Holdemania filiformis DSM 12042 TaxID=545696 RepID=B9Y5K7_9FIRM|nr:hypothetical protein HOLDEFILI_01089 [Holdemania filiformis DSM 12042]
MECGEGVDNKFFTGEKTPEIRRMDRSRGFSCGYLRICLTFPRWYNYNTIK